MKKIGIATFHVAINYGVYLQAYALQEKIRELGYDPVIIDYRKRTDERQGKTLNILKKIFIERISVHKYLQYKLQAAQIADDMGVKRRKEAFSHFAEKYFCLTKEYDSYKSVVCDNVGYEACVCGSDQIWNPDYTKGNPFYFLEFVEPAKRIAYAPSIAVDDMTEYQKKLLSDKMEEFAFLSLREKSSALYWGKIINKNIVNAMDPTLLFPPNFWKRLAIMPNEKEPYLLCYFLGHSNFYMDLAKLIRDKFNLKVIIFPFSYKAIAAYDDFKVYASIEEFLGYFENADFILTDSFHGTAFAVNFNIDFYAMKRRDSGEKMHKRIKDLLERVNLQDRVITGNDMSHDLEISRIDYQDSNREIEKWRIESDNYLKTALASVLND